jgi:hypothetical protein
MRFKDASDATMACTFLAEFTEARRQPQLNTAPSCSYSKAPPLELRGAPAFSLDANGGCAQLQRAACFQHSEAHRIQLHGGGGAVV